MALLDAPILPPLTSLTGSEAFGVVADRRNLKGITINQLMGLSSGDVASVASASAVTIANRLTVITGTTSTTLTFPAASGALRELIIINSSTAALTLPTLAAGSSTTWSSSAARFLSNGTGWYRVS